MQSRAALLVQRAQRDALRFAEADTDADMKLSFDEFLRMQPTQVREAMEEEARRGAPACSLRSPTPSHHHLRPTQVREGVEEAEIRQWFEEGGDGETLSVHSFFNWMLSKMVLQKVNYVFNAYDGDNSGAIEMDEFQ